MRSLRWLGFLGALGLLMPACSDDATTAPPNQDGKVTPKDGSIPLNEAGNPLHDSGKPLADGGIPKNEAGNPLYDGGKPPTGDGGGCINECTDKAKQCTAGGWQECVKLANGCTAWGATTACGSGEICSGGQCMKNCINQCSVGARMCSGTGYVTCENQSSGCTDWGTVTPCTGSDVCSGGQCVKNCADQCTQGAKQCSGTGVQTCDTNATTGCTEWGNPVPCNPGEICSGGVCVQNCSNQCSANATRCSGPQLQTCKVLASGCTDWDTPQPCATGTCVNGKCDSGVCQTGDKRCNGTTVEECDAGGFWVVQQICPQACNTGACSTTVTCTAVTRRCNGDVIEECNPTGTAWLYLDACQNGCTAGLCTGGCTPGETRCNGTNLESCKTDGTGWQVDKSCSTTFCTMLLSGGAACAELELKMDNTSQTLDGEHVYAGDVILKNNSAITVGAKGWLRIRAKNVDIDATSSIQAPAVGDDPTGRGLDRQSKSCYYYGTRYYDVGGSGGGYGTAGSQVSYTGSCTVYLTGGKASGAYIADIHMGSRGGSCTNANGGGMIDVIASQKLTVSGNLKADGGTKAAGGGSYCAGGSGGGIRLVAEDLNVNGVLSTAGGSGGGTGRIKLLYGSKHAIAATTTGVVEQSLIPPMNLRSSTHPDQTRYYNDGYANFNVSWTRPFSSNAGYFYDLTTALPTSQTHVPDTQSTWLTTESESFTPDKLKTGDNYYNVIAVGAGAATGTVEGAFRVQINSATPTVSSTSHPSQTVWYNLPTAFFEWTNPQADENFVAYYFAFDRYADTIPTKADSKLPVGTKTTYKPNLPAGSIWYFHVLSEDTMGYLTKTARHFKVQIGPDPGMGGISGDVREDGSSPPTMLDGVKVSLNRGLLTTTTANGGKYFFSNNVPAIVNSYEVRAEKAGYETFTKQITVVAGQNTSLNILLKKLP